MARKSLGTLLLADALFQRAEDDGFSRFRARRILEERGLVDAPP